MFFISEGTSQHAPEYRSLISYTVEDKTLKGFISSLSGIGCIC